MVLEIELPNLRAVASDDSIQQPVNLNPMAHSLHALLLSYPELVFVENF